MAINGSLNNCNTCSLFEHQSLLVMKTNVQQMRFDEPELNAIENSKAKFKVEMMQEFWVSLWGHHLIIITIIVIWNVRIYLPECALLQTGKMEVAVTLEEFLIIYQNVWFTNHCRWWGKIPPKCWQEFTKRHGVIIRKIKIVCRWIKCQRAVESEGPRSDTDLILFRPQSTGLYYNILWESYLGPPADPI